MTCPYLVETYRGKRCVFQGVWEWRKTREIHVKNCYGNYHVCPIYQKIKSINYDKWYKKPEVNTKDAKTLTIDK
jgi:hypothetical protein